MSKAKKSGHLTMRTDPADVAHLIELADAARSRGKPFIQRSSIIRAALAFSAAHLEAFSTLCL